MDKGKSLPGTIALNFGDSLYIYNSDTVQSKFRIQKDGQYSYGGLRWLNRSEGFIGIEYHESPKEGIFKSDVVVFNRMGEIVEKIFIGSEGQIANRAYVSQNDEWLLFSTELKPDIEQSPLISLNNSYCLSVLSLNNRKVLVQIPDIGRTLSFRVYESPWILNEPSFIYSLNSDRNIRVVDQPQYKIEKDDRQPGIYKYNISSKTNELIIPHGQFPICSPNERVIAYILDNQLFTMNLDDFKTSKIFEFDLDDQVVNIHWTPDGKNVYVALYSYDDKSKRKKKEKLFEIASRKNLHFNSLGHGFTSYTWK